MSEAAVRPPWGRSPTQPCRPCRVAAIATLALVVAGCSSMSERERTTAQGAGIGAVTGAAVGAATGGHAGTGAVVGGALGAVAGNLWSRHMEEKRIALERASAGTGVDVSRTADNRLKLDVPSDFSFDVGSAAIKPPMRPVLDEIARNLDPAVRVDIIGYTDSTGTPEINGPLSQNRAASVRDYLATRGVDPARTTVQGMGASQPVASNETAEGRAMNRRVEIYLTQRPA